MNTNLYKQNTTIIIMGLDCIVKIHNGHEYTSDLPLEIVEIFKTNVAVYNISSFDIGLYHDKYYVSFRGKAYSDVVKNLTGYSLYNDLNKKELESMYIALNFILDHNSHTIKEIDKCFDDTSYDNHLQNWIDLMANIYIPSPAQLTGLKEIFKICYENNLQLYACY